MSHSRWYERAAAVIARIDADLPQDADLATRKRALKGQGWPAHQGTRWGRTMWGRAVRDYLRQHGYRSPEPKAALPLFSPLDRARTAVQRRFNFPPHPDSVRGAR